MVDTKSIIAAAAVIIVLAVLYVALSTSKPNYPQSTTLGSTVTQQTTTVLNTNNTLPNLTAQVAEYVNSQQKFNVTYYGYQFSYTNQSGWYQIANMYSRNSSFLFQYQKYDNYSRINFEFGGQPNSSYLYSPGRNILCAGSDAFALSNSSNASLRCTSISTSQTEQLFGFVAVGNFSFTGPGSAYSLQRSQIMNVKDYPSSVNGSICEFTSGEFIGNMSGNFTSIKFNECISSTKSIPLNYNITYQSISGNVSAIGGQTSTITHVYGLLRHVDNNTNQSYVAMSG